MVRFEARSHLVPRPLARLHASARVPSGLAAAVIGRLRLLASRGWNADLFQCLSKFRPRLCARRWRAAAILWSWSEDARAATATSSAGADGPHDAFLSPHDSQE